MDHPFIRGKRGVCIFPVRVSDEVSVPCGKMRALHVSAPISVTRDDVVVDGHARLDAAIAVGFTHVPVDVVD